MTDKKLTDEEIKKALVCCEIAYDQDCTECPLYPDDGEIACREVLREEALDLITRQQAENENLKVENQSLRSAANSLKMHYEEAQAEIERLKESLNIELENFATEYDNKIKAEAYKEFAERLKEKSGKVEMVCSGALVQRDYTISEKTLDNLLKKIGG